MSLRRIPATIVTGFLGSGKTSLLRDVLRSCTELRTAVLVNEFGALDIDGEILRDCAGGCEASGDSQFYELANGCICCTVEEEFLPVMQRLMERADSLDQILIETSGLALPKPLVQAFNWPDIRRHCTVDAVIALVDGPALAAGDLAADPQAVHRQRLADPGLDHEASLRELLEDQLAAADLVVVSKDDELDGRARALVAERLAPLLPPAVRVIHNSAGSTDVAQLLSLGAASEERIEGIASHHDRHHEEGAHHEHAHEHFDSLIVRAGELDGARLMDALAQLVAGQQILRIKGFAAVHGKPMRQLCHAVGRRLQCHFDRLWAAGEERSTRLVFIGLGLRRDEIERAVQGAAP